MKNKKKIVRNFAVFCAASKLRNSCVEIKSNYQDKKKMRTSTIEYILSDVFKEQINYDNLQYYYSEVLQGKENTYFSYAYFLDKNHAIRIDKDSNILLYYYQDKIQIGIPWDYPHLISCIGTIKKEEEFSSFLIDYKKMPTLNYMLKYFFHKEKITYSIKSICEGYLVDDFIKIVIDDHITFQWMDANHNYQEKYIADSWWSTKKDIMCDLTSMSFSEFGKKYVGFWGR